MKEFVMYIDSGISVRAKNEQEAMELARSRFLEMVKNNEYDIHIDEVLESE